MRIMHTPSTVALLALVVMPSGILAQSLPARPGNEVAGVVHREGDERYRLTFETSGVAIVQVSPAGSDCAFQVGSQGFSESDSSPVDWTDGQPGQPVRHSFRVQSGRPGTVWVKLRTRVSAVSGSQWSAVACSANGPYYRTPDRDGSAGPAPATYEGRPVQEPIAFRFMARMEGSPVAARKPGGTEGTGGGGAEDDLVAQYRLLLPAVLQAEKKPWHTRFEFLANAVKTAKGYHVNYKTYCLIEQGPDKGKDHACYEFDGVLDLAAIKTAVADMKRRLGR